MTVLTSAVAAGIPGRLAPYRHLPRLTAGHRVPGCAGYCTQDDCCSAEIASIKVDGELVVELYADRGDKPTAVVFTFDARHEGTLLRTTNPDELLRKAAEFHQFADGLTRTARILQQLHDREAK